MPDLSLRLRDGAAALRARSSTMRITVGQGENLAHIHMPEAMHMRGGADFDTEEIRSIREHGYQRKVPKLTRTVERD